MKLTYYQLERQLHQKLLPAYIVSSDEIILKNESIALIRDRAAELGFDNRVRLIVETGFDWGELYNELHSGSLFTTKRLVELDLTRSLPNKIGAEILNSYSRQINADTLLIINADKLDAKTLKTSWCAALEKVGALLTIWPLPHDQLPQWIIKRGKQLKLTIPVSAAKTIGEYVEGNLVAANMALEKLALYAPEKMDDATLAMLMVDESHYSIFELVEHCTAGETLRALHILEQLKAEATEPSLILWGLTREIRILAELAVHVASGHALETLMQKQRIFFKRQQAARAFLARYKLKDIWSFLIRAGEIDNLIKGVNKGNVWDALQLFCLSFSPQSIKESTQTN